jgi:hypothetical protein
MPEINEAQPGRFCWFELATTDQAAAKQSYAGLFGWTFNEVPMGPNDFYTMFQWGGRDVNYVSTTNCDETARKAMQLGGKTCMAPFDIPNVGRMATLQDPQGAAFSVIHLTNPE